MDALTHSAQDYMEAILILTMERGKARVKEVADFLGVKKPSVVAAVKSLVDKGLLRHEHYGYLELTSHGIAVAREIHHKHQVIFRFLHSVLGVDARTAQKDACQIEHYISTGTLERFVKFLEFVENFPDKQREPKWLVYFKRYVKTGEPPPCEEVDLSEGGHNKVIPLNQLEAGRKAVIKRVEGDHFIKNRLLSMGVVPGKVVSIVKVAPLGDPIEVAVGDFHLSLRKEEARQIEVEVQ